MESVITETDKLRAESIAKFYPKGDKAIVDLLRLTVEIGEIQSARLLCCAPEFIASWFPRRLPNGVFEPGLEPSGGFIGTALAILRNKKT